ncbi:MAG: sigma-70 family RNA polymerase sigma factor [Nannocystaceae bacterium]|nr:sigma-70 family RNA polymerase sigma factor [Nannocystaceae bacterium]
MDGDHSAELYRQWRDGDASAGDEIASLYCARVLSFFESKVPEAAEDLMQKTFLACLASTTDPASIRSFRGFLFGIARKMLLQHFDGRGKLKGEVPVSHLSLAALRTTPTQRIARDQQEARVHAALAELVLDQQIALELYYWHKMSVREIATALDLSEGGVRAKLHRARQQFKKTLAGSDDAEDEAS